MRTVSVRENAKVLEMDARWIYVNGLMSQSQILSNGNRANFVLRLVH